MKIKAILLSMFAVAALASCSTDNGGSPGEGPTPGPGGNGGDGYMTLSVTRPVKDRSRAGSGELPVGDADEATIDKMFAVTFNSAKNVVAATGVTAGATEITWSGSGESSSKPKAIKVSGSSKYLLIVANPGPKLAARLATLQVGESWADLNKAITNPLAAIATDKTDLLVDEIRNIASGTKEAGTATYNKFTMINSGGIDDPNDGLIAIDPDKIKNPGDYTGTDQEKEDAAETDANGDRQEVMIERLTAKMQVSAAAPTTVLPAGARYDFQSWTLDVLNSTFYPYAVKKATTASHTPGEYTSNFYTVDPNFEGGDAAHAGLYYNQKINRKPNVNWLLDGTFDYAIENTMKAVEQEYKNATRIVLKATYYPGVSGTYAPGSDWFAHTVITAGVPVTSNFESLAKMFTRYDEIVTKINLADPQDPALNSEIAFVEACDEFYKRVKAELIAIGKGDVNLDGFKKLEQVKHLDEIANGGELLKGDNAIKWYQKGLNYYYYEIVHDNTLQNVNMAFGKYGIVRNNWYKLTLDKVNGPGKPWYPTVDPKDPDPSGPNPEDPIDDYDGLLNFSIQVAPWISWSTKFEIG